MPEEFFQNLATEDRLEALRRAERSSSVQAFILEKDIWIVATLGAIFHAPFADHLTFKGGTSLSKVWRAINRFSEDIDITYDIRAFADDLVSGTGEEALPPSRSQQKRWTQVIRMRLAEWVRDEAQPVIESGLSKAGFNADVSPDQNSLFIRYTPLFEANGFLQSPIRVEFGARSTGEPRVSRSVVCDAAEHLPDLVFPETDVTVMRPERTFWEKAMAIHVFCRQQRSRGERKSRHWFDLVRLDDAGITEKALADRELALEVARHNASFYFENDVHGQRIDYRAAVTGDLQLVPDGALLALLAGDYANMVGVGMLLGEEESFSTLMERCADIQNRLNQG